MRSRMMPCALGAILHDSKTLIVPYYTVLASANGGMWVTGGSVKMHARA